MPPGRSTQAAPSADEERALAHLSPGGFGLVTDKSFRYPRHIELIDREVVAAIERGQRALREGAWEQPEILLVEVPPRHGKSTLISEKTPAWFLGRFPDKRVMLGSYQATFAATWGRKARNLLEEFGGDLFGVEVDPASRAAAQWDIKGHKGGMQTAGVGGDFTGRGAHLLIIDDPVKNAEEALSETIREKQQEWWRSTIRTRIEPGAVVVILMTRWHYTDLGGFVLQRAADGADPVREIRLPAIAEAEDVLGRDPGEALWPERYSLAALEKLKTALGPYWFSAMFQGTPTPDEGGFFQRRDFRYFDVQDGGVRLRDTGEFIGDAWLTKFQTVDLAASEKETADYTVMAEVWVTPKRQMLVRSVHRARIPGPDQPAFFEAHYAGGRVFFESIGYQSMMIANMRRRGFPAEAVYPDKDKATRAGAAGAMYRTGQVYHHGGAEWLSDFEHELLAFPVGEHDDQVDAIAYAARALPNVGIRGRERKPERRGTVLGRVSASDF